MTKCAGYDDKRRKEIERLGPVAFRNNRKGKLDEASKTPYRPVRACGEFKQGIKVWYPFFENRRTLMEGESLR